MDLTHSTTKQRQYTHLSYQERVILEVRLKDGLTPSAIARELGRAKNTVRNEIARGRVTQIKQGKFVQIYLADAGQHRYEKNRKACRPALKKDMCKEFMNFVTEQFGKKGWSLDSICGYAKLTMPEMARVCTKTLYNYIEKGMIGIKNIDLPVKVKRNTKKSTARKNKKNLGESIDKKPDISNRKEFGHWEIDTV